MALIQSEGGYQVEDGCECWICAYIRQVQGMTIGEAFGYPKTEVLAEHPPQEAVQRETTEERNERIWQAIKDAAGG